jgi:flagella basal body P-ring formation protein FlgA
MMAARRIATFFGVVAALLWLPVAAPAADMAVVATRIVYPGETVSADTLDQVTLRPNARVTSPFVREIEEADGKVAKRTILPGKLIPLNSLREPYLVEAGQSVTVIFQQDGLTIQATAVPLQPGSLGDVLRLRNADSGKVFTGIVMADGTIRVGG